MDHVTTTDPTASENEARHDMLRMVEAYDSLNQGLGTTGLAVTFLLGMQSAVTRLLQIQNRLSGVESMEQSTTILELTEAAAVR
jgi:hypothetical protein